MAVVYDIKQIGRRLREQISVEHREAIEGIAWLAKRDPLLWIEAKQRVDAKYRAKDRGVFDRFNGRFRRMDTRTREFKQLPFNPVREVQFGQL